LSPTGADAANLIFALLSMATENKNRRFVT
jgi:hypothetical protein